MRMLGQRRWPGLSRRGAVCPRENRPATRRCRAICYAHSTTGRLQLRPGGAGDMRRPRSFVRETRGLTGDLLPLFYLGSPTFASTRAARAGRNVSRQPAANAAPHDHDFRCVSRDTRATSRKGVLSPFKARQKNRLFGGKSVPFPALTPQTQKYRAGGSIPPISTTKTARFCGKLRVRFQRDTRA